MGADNATLLKHAIVERVRTGQGSGMGKSGTFAGFRSPHVKGHDGLMGNNRPGNIDKIPAPPNGFEIKPDDPGMRTAGQMCHAINDVQVGFVAHTDPAGKSEAVVV